jgi:hypothetical protein
LGYDNTNNIGLLPSDMSNLPYISFRDNTVNVVSVSCGYQHSCALFANKRIFCWGGSNPVLGQSALDQFFFSFNIGDTFGSMTSYNYIVFSDNDNADMIACGFQHTYNTETILINEREIEIEREKIDIQIDR